MVNVIEIGVCDDDKTIRDQIEDLVVHYPLEKPFAVAFHTFASAEELLAYTQPLDLLYLDIELGDGSGVELVPTLQKMHPEIKIIFVTSHWKYFIYSHRLNVFQFLTKPLEQRVFYEELERFCQQYRLRKALYEVGLPGGKMQIPISEIVYIEAAGRHLQVYHAPTGMREKFGKIGDEEKALKPYGFIRTHQSFLVNAAHITKIKNLQVFLLDPISHQELSVPVSKARIAQVRNDHQDWLLERNV